MTPLTEEQKKYALQNARTVRMERIVIFKVTRELDGVEYTEEIRSDQMKAIGENGGPRRYTPENEREMEGAYLAGESLARIAKNWDSSPAAIHGILRKRGVEMRPRGAPRGNGDDRHPDHRTLTALEDYK